jgi:hypothetical protein
MKVPTHLDSEPPRQAALTAFNLYNNTGYALQRLAGCDCPSPAAKRILKSASARNHRGVFSGFNDLFHEVMAELAD